MEKYSLSILVSGVPTNYRELSNSSQLVGFENDVYSLFVGGKRIAVCRGRRGSVTDVAAALMLWGSHYS